MTTAAEQAQQAWQEGARVDLAGCVYGPSHVEKGAFAADVPGYYRLLAGLVHGASRICELGTHYGGATLAMARGMAKDGRIVTVDVTKLENPLLAAERRIERVQGDVLAASVLD